MRAKAPIVSVIMTVYNAAPFLDEAIKSILDQSFSDFEFIIIDDGSTDRSLEIIKSYKDSRIVLRSRPNKGVPRSSNEALSIARGKYIARQDADDLSDRNRLKKQVEFLEAHPEIDLLGTNYKARRINGDIAFITDMFTKPDDLKFAIVFSNQFGHGSVMARKKILKNVGGYRDISIVHDYDLWVRVSKVARMGNLKESLYTWRYHDKSLSNSNFNYTMEQVRDVRKMAFDYYKSHKREYNELSFHPFSTKSPVNYCCEKSRMFRSMSLLYSYEGLRRWAVPSILKAIIFAPWLTINYKYCWFILFRKDMISGLRYD